MIIKLSTSEITEAVEDYLLNENLDPKGIAEVVLKSDGLEGIHAVALIVRD